ncbi:MAG: hypothetical protein OXC07_06225 [Kistimonas sp.]|nr:hypothetical protein [Kistimonas sp.]
MHNTSRSTSPAVPSPLCAGTASQAPLVSAQTREAVQQLAASCDQQAVPERSLAIRSIRPLTSPSQPCPGKDVIKDLLRTLPPEVGEIEPLCLGMGLGLSARLLLGGNAIWADAFRRMLILLRMADFPLSINKLSDALEQPPVRAFEVAQQVRALARSKGVDRLEDRHEPLWIEMARLLTPLAGGLDEEQLLVALRAGVPGQELVLLLDLMALHFHFVRSDSERQDTVEMALHRSFAAWREKDKVPSSARSCEDWLELFARSGASATTLEYIASQWELVPPTGCADWADYLQVLGESAATRLLRAHQQRPDARVPLGQLWLLVHNYSRQPAFALALDEATDPDFMEPDCRHLHGLVSLLHHAQGETAGAKSISWSSLCALARHGCVDPCFAARIEQDSSQEPTRSRRLRPSDLLCLVEGPAAPQLAWAAAAVLGVGALSVCSGPDHQKVPVRDSALVIWRRIYNRVPWLETGHLVQVLRLLGGDELVEKLTGHADRHRRPAASVSQRSARCAEFVAMFDVLQQQPEWVQAFINLKAVDQRLSYLAPAGTAESWRLLNCLALDPLLLAAWRSFAHQSRTAPRPQAAALHEQGLEQDAEGLPQDYMCPLSRAYMDDPVAIGAENDCWHYFSRHYLLESLQRAGPFNPLTRAPLTREAVPAVDEEYRSRIRAWRVAHPELEEEGKPFVAPGSQGT